MSARLGQRGFPGVREMVADAMGKPRELLHWGERPYRSDEPMWLVGDNQRFREATSTWCPTIGLQEGIRRMLDHARELRKRDEHQHGV